MKYVKELKKDIAEMQEYFPVICGEWCLFNSLAVGCDTKGGQTVLNGVEGMAQETVSAEEKKKIYNAVAEAQLKVQSASALSSISIAFAWIPVITFVICVICMAFFSVDKYYAKVVEDLSQGKHRGE